MAIKNKIIKSISALLIISIITPSFVAFYSPKKAEAQMAVIDAALISALTPPTWATKVLTATGVPSTVMNTALHVKDFAAFILKQALMLIAKAVLARITQATINWINSDFHGAPLFVENPESFFRDIGKFVVRRIVDLIGYDTFRFPFGPQTALNVISSYKSQLDINAQYTLSKVINDPLLLVQYRNNFNYGGWNGFLINTQYPQNNYLGFNALIKENLASQLEGTLQAPAEKIESLLQQGMGFLSPQSCPDNPLYNNGVNEFVKPQFDDVAYNDAHPDFKSEGVTGRNSADDKEWTAAKDRARAEWAKTNTCPGGLKNTTPGSVAGNQIMMAMGSTFRQSELGQALGNSISAIFDALINHFLDKGLNALGGAISGSPSNDNWSYNGNTLGGGSASYATGQPAPLNIPQNASVIVNQDISTKILGGTMPYSIQTPPNVAVATAKIDVSGSGGPTLVITGKAKGDTLMSILDASGHSATIRISVHNIGDLIANPSSVVTDNSHPITIKISGGQEPYSMQTSPNEAIAVAVFEDSSLVVAGINQGTTLVKIKDNVGKIIEIPITISGAGDIIIPQNISVGINQTVNTKISGGTAPYKIKNQYENMAIVNVTGNNLDNLEITGVTAGLTTVFITDSSFPNQSTSTTVTVNPIEALLTIPKSISIDVNQSESIFISGGTKNYSIKTRPDRAVAEAEINNRSSSIVIRGFGSGRTEIVIEDSTKPTPYTITVPIIVGALTIEPKSPSFGVNNITTITISGGVAPYSITSFPVARVAEAEIINNNNIGNNQNTATLRIVGKGPGQTSVEIKDNSTKTISIQIKVN